MPGTNVGSLDAISSSATISPMSSRPSRPAARPYVEKLGLTDRRRTLAMLPLPYKFEGETEGDSAELKLSGDDRGGGILILLGGVAVIVCPIETLERSRSTEEAGIDITISML